MFYVIGSTQYHWDKWDPRQRTSMPNLAPSAGADVRHAHPAGATTRCWPWPWPSPLVCLWELSGHGVSALHQQHGLLRAGAWDVAHVQDFLEQHACPDRQHRTRGGDAPVQACRLPAICSGELWAPWSRQQCGSSKLLCLENQRHFPWPKGSLHWIQGCPSVNPKPLIQRSFYLLYIVSYF